MNSVPGWWTFLLLTLAGARTWRLVAKDTVLDRPRRWALGTDEEDLPTVRYREKLDVLVTCPWCAGFWLTLGWFIAWWIDSRTLVVAAVAAASHVVGMQAKLDED